MQMNQAYGFGETQALTDAQIIERAPSVFAEAPHDSRSDRYVHIPTGQIVTALRDEGWMPTLAQQSKARDFQRRNFTKHMLRFRHVDYLGHPARVGDTVPEIVLVNSHDGSSSYQLHGGIFRFVCSNGMVVGDTAVQKQRIKHQGDIVGNVIEGVYDVVQDLPAVSDQIGEFKATDLSDEEQQAFATAAMALRWDEPEQSGFRPDQVIRPRRREDRASDLWTVFNRAQENLVRGGLSGVKRDARGRRRRTRSRQINGVDQSVGLNKALWTLAEQMRQIKGQAA